MAARAGVDDQAMLASISRASSNQPRVLMPPAMLSRQDFLQLVRNAPLVSIDLIVRDAQGLVLLGLRNNRPAQGWWFVPGGIVRKDERLERAFRRISEAELGSVHELSAARALGHYEHLYDDNFAGEPGFGTHYVVLAWELLLQPAVIDFPPQQHRDYRWVGLEELARDPVIHPNSRAYAASLAQSPASPPHV